MSKKIEEMNRVKLLRLKDDGDTTLGVFVIDGQAVCGTVEDQEQKGEKVYAETRIPNGIYKIGLRSAGGFHNRYSTKFPDIHKGMLCIYNAPDWKLLTEKHNFQYILIHCGNTDDHSAGCVLTNFGINFDTMVGDSSVNAYKHIYPILRDKVLNSPNGYIELEVNTL